MLFGLFIGEINDVTIDDPSSSSSASKMENGPTWIRSRCCYWQS